ncbi:MAG: alpha/beta fold hydrolase [Armatimonadetes bacterium]|nr:alpha/beta fold hydrolase [Anaerolineae bacterium]
MLRKVMMVLVLAVLSVSLVGAQAVGQTFVLVHGAFQDASGWAGVTAALEAEGHTVIVVTLAGRGTDETPLSEISLDLYRDTVIAAIEAQSEPVVLVGHSFGGITISAVAEAIPSQITTLVYLAAYLPQDGESLVSIAANDRYSLLGQEGNFIIAADFSTGAVNAEVFPTAFCPDCTPEQLEVVAASQLTEPLAPQNTPVLLTPENFGSVRKAYLLTAQDLIVSPQLQALMLSYTPVERVLALNAGHAAYISAPEAVAAALVAATQ